MIISFKLTKHLVYNLLLYDLFAILLKLPKWIIQHFLLMNVTLKMEIYKDHCQSYLLSIMYRASKWFVWGNKSNPYIFLIINSGAFLFTVVGRVNWSKLSWIAPALHATYIKLSNPLHLLNASITSLLNPGLGGSNIAHILLPRCCSQIALIWS